MHRRVHIFNKRHTLQHHISFLPIVCGRLIRTQRPKSRSMRESCRARTCDIQIPPMRAPVSKSDALPTELITPLTMGYIVYHAIVPIAMPIDDVTDLQRYTPKCCVKCYGCIFRPTDRPTARCERRPSRARTLGANDSRDGRETNAFFPFLLVSIRTVDRHRIRRKRRSIDPSRHHARIGGGGEQTTTRAR